MNDLSTFPVKCNCVYIHGRDPKEGHQKCVVTAYVKMIDKIHICPYNTEGAIRQCKYYKKKIDEKESDQTFRRIVL